MTDDIVRESLNIDELNTVNGGLKIDMGWISVTLNHGDGSQAIGFNVQTGNRWGGGYVILPPK